MRSARGQTSGTAGRRQGGLASGLVVAQIALSFVLVVAAGLFVRTFVALATRDLGFERDRVLVVSVNADSASIDPAQRLRIYDDVRHAVRSLPGVADATLSAQTPPVVGPAMILGMRQISGGALLSGRELGDRMGPLSFVSPGWFTAGRCWHRDRVATSVYASRFVAALLYGLEPHDPATLVSAAATLGAIGALAGAVPAWRASRIDPADVLRES